MKWQFLSSLVPKSLEEVIPILLQNRGIQDSASFFKPENPLTFSPKYVGIDPEYMKVAVERLQKARDKQEKVIIFGDYDADGICSTAVMWLALREFGIEALPFIPHREKHGYGVSDKAIDEILQAGTPDLIVTVDNGIVAHAALKRLKEAGVDVIVTDHHSLELDKSGKPHLPEAVAVVHTTKLCGTTVAWMLAKEVLSEDTKTSSLVGELLDLCGIATIADQVPLQAANRSFAYFGIQTLRKTQRPGLLALCMQAQIKPSEISTYHINYVLGPRINAMGRLEHGMNALRLLCTKNPSNAAELAKIVSDVNTRRQELTDDLLQHAINQAEKQKDDNILIVADPEYHEGIIGLIAGRLSELYYKPAVAISIGESTVKGSARSVPGINITDLIRLTKDELLSVGGHPLAAGFGAELDRLEVVTKNLKALAKEHVAAELLHPTLTVDIKLPGELITTDLATELLRWEPVGQGNQKPLFVLDKMEVLSVFAMGRDNRHLKLVVKSGDDSAPLHTVGWGLGEKATLIQVGQVISLAGHVEINEYKGRRNVQIVVKDIQV